MRSRILVAVSRARSKGTPRETSDWTRIPRMNGRRPSGPTTTSGATELDTARPHYKKAVAEACRTEQWGSTPGSVGRRSGAPHEAQDAVALAGEGALVRGLDVEAQERLGVRRPQVEPPVREGDGQPVELVRAAGRIRGPHRGQGGGNVGHARIQLAALVVLEEGRPELGERPAAALERAQEQQESRRAVVGDVAGREVKVVVAGELTAEARAGLAQRRLHERVPDAPTRRLPAPRSDRLGDDAARAQIVEDGRAGAGPEQAILQHELGEQRRHQVGGNALAALVHEED